MKDSDQPVDNKKTEQLRIHSADATNQTMTTNHGLPVNDDQNSLKTGDRGATLLEDFILREKITHFDHERIPERVVHARGAAAHGYFQVYESMAEYTKAHFLLDPGLKTPVFVRFSTVAGSRGSSDMARDARGFAVKFYTEQGVYDLVGNNIPVFFIQDAMKFPDLVHAVKPEPHNEIPQAASAHDTFWDFISLMPESMHMIMWVMSDRAIPRSYRMMEGFGVHTFRFVNAEGKAHFVKFHWKPLLGVHSVCWDEAQKISGKDPDFHRRDLWEAIENGAFPEWELGVQIIPDEDEFKFEIDLLDPTKIIPEELVPVKRIGKMVLNRNPDNFFAETEQVAFHPGNVVSGIDFTNDPLLQGRLFSYTDTQLIRLGGPNFHEIPINRSVVPVHNNQRDGFMKQTINKGRVSYNPNSLAGGCPFQAKAAEGGFQSFTERIDSKKIRSRSKSFLDHFSQATLFYESQSEPEKQHIANALKFELGKVETIEIRQRMLGLLSKVNKKLAKTVADGLGLPVPEILEEPMNHSIPADADPQDYQPIFTNSPISKSAALSMSNTIKDTIKTRQIALLAADGFDAKSLTDIKKTLEKEGAKASIVAPKLGIIKSNEGKELKVDQSLLTAASVLFDAVYIADGTKCVEALLEEPEAIEFIEEAYKHCKPIATKGKGVELLRATRIIMKELAKEINPLSGLLINQSDEELVNAIAQHRFWEREKKDKHLN
ncbi:catalase [Emticicia sp. 21SJ11W-3]|uniref:catalase n=1 Tax=Emticicia sp. 21SJ11W-3 TaxID=2916755 RepID=UPI00209E9CA6|nr:catalase [Emticicia sp. 21SJ11W-3]UTA69458.1 catalase [Emticicia sp. 21SJ11W-3]